MTALGTAGSGREEVLGFRLGPSESAEGWGRCLESLKEGGRRPDSVRRGRTAVDAGGHKAGIPRILQPNEPGRAGPVLVLPLPRGRLEAPLHLERGRGVPRLSQKKAEGQASHPFPQIRIMNNVLIFKKKECSK